MIVRQVNLDKNSVKYNGWLRVDGAEIKNKHGKPTQLVGISTHGLQWFDELYTPEAIRQLKEEFKINVFRVALYVNPDDNGYVANRALSEKVKELVDACIEQDIYAVIDWHILNDNDPLTYKAEALEFFGEMSEKYANTPNVIYEICNEPNGEEVDWKKHIKPYADEVIAKIREHSPKSLIIVGTPDWSKDLTSVSLEPITDENVVYALHFYAGSHNKTLRDKIDTFREKGLAVFVSECGDTDASGDGRLYDNAFMRWIEFLDEKKISWIYWSYANKDETTALLAPNAVPDLNKKDGAEPSLESYLSESGHFIKGIMTRAED